MKMNARGVGSRCLFNVGEITACMNAGKMIQERKDNASREESGY